MTTSWMWAGGDNVAGVRLDKEQGVLRWQNEIGCHCAGTMRWCKRPFLI